jgi:ATP-dependent Clp protease ATP-binding subunit ClpC
MFERFTDRARRAVVLAQEEARALRHNYIGTEHLLLGLVAEGEGLAAQALALSGVTLDAARAAVHEIIGVGTLQPTAHIPFTPRAKKVLEFALRESRQLGHTYIGTEHILLGMIKEGEGVAAQVLGRLGEPEAVRDKVRELMTLPAPTAAAASTPALSTELVILRTLNEILARLDAIERKLGEPPAATA